MKEETKTNQEDFLDNFKLEVPILCSCSCSLMNQLDFDTLYSVLTQEDKTCMDVLSKEDRINAFFTIIQTYVKFLFKEHVKECKEKQEPVLKTLEIKYDSSDRLFFIRTY